MNRPVEFQVGDVAPARDAVLDQLGIPPDTELEPRVEAAFTAARDAFRETVSAVGITEVVTAAEFGVLYAGEGGNEPTSPVADIYPNADHLATFAVTLGPRITEAISRAFAANDFAWACMLDAMASVAADAAADRIERRFEESLRAQGWNPPAGAALRYSPGYCGWDITGQRALFAHLRPARIGMSLTASCLMQPLKSVSGVLVAGATDIHRFPPDYEFCSRCETHSCRERLRAVLAR